MNMLVDNNVTTASCEECHIKDLSTERTHKNFLLCNNYPYLVAQIDDLDMLR